MAKLRKLALPTKKVPKKKASPAPVNLDEETMERVEECLALLADAEESMEQLSARVENLTSEAAMTVNDAIQEAFGEVASFNRNLRDSLLGEVYRFLEHAPVWELVLLRGSTVLLNYEQLKPYYDRGFKIVANSYGARSGDFEGVMLHRPVIPKTEAEFKKMFKSYVQKGEIAQAKPSVKMIDLRKPSVSVKPKGRLRKKGNKQEH